jgi:hypothetical protein
MRVVDHFESVKADNWSDDREDDRIPDEWESADDYAELAPDPNEDAYNEAITAYNEACAAYRKAYATYREKVDNART